MSTSLSANGQAREDPSTALATLRVEAVFRDVDEQQAHAIAAEMITRAHELANQPERECDVDVSVQVALPEDDGARPSAAL